MKAHRHLMASGNGTRLLGHRLNKLKTVIVTALVIGALTLGSLRAEATPLPPGTSVFAAGIPAPGGTEVDSIFHDDTCYADAGTACDVWTAVLRAKTGTLDFYYQVTNTSPQNEVRRLPSTSFKGLVTDVWWVIDGSSVPCSACGGFFQDGTEAPDRVDRDGPGLVVGFDFPGGFAVGPLETSRVLLIRTNATVVVPGFVSVINGGGITERAFAPDIAFVAPEPASLVLFGMGLFGTAAALRRRRTTA